MSNLNTNPLQGIFKKIEFIFIQFACESCSNISYKTVPNDIPTYVTCTNCKKVHVVNLTEDNKLPKLCN